MEEKKLPGAEALSALNLAFLGDCVYDLYVREGLLRSEPELPAREMHRKASEAVCAKAQAAAAAAVFERLSEEEKTIFLRGRNAHPGHMPKNAAPADYHAATALEAVVGYLYLRGETQRLAEILALSAAAAADEEPQSE